MCATHLRKILQQARMYKHMVLWKLKDSAEGLSKVELAVEVKKRLETLPGIISEIEDFEVGINIGAYGASFFDVSLICTECR